MFRQLNVIISLIDGIEDYRVVKINVLFGINDDCCFFYLMTESLAFTVLSNLLQFN